MTEQQIEFSMWITGHDKETILQLWEDFNQNPQQP